MWIVFLAGIAAAALNAASSVFQRLAAPRAETHVLFGRRFTTEAITNRFFVLGISLQIAAFFLQATALSKGPLVIVEPLLTSDLVFLLLFIYWKVGIKPGIKEWIGVGAIIIGLSDLFIVGHPEGGHLKYILLPWMIAVGVVALFVIASITIVRRSNSVNVRAILAGLSVSSAFALNAAFTKLLLNQFAQSGLKTVVTSWPLYALIVSGISSIYLMQNAYGSGPVAITQPIMEITEPTLSVIIGMTIFGDYIKHSFLAIIIELIGVGALTSGIVLLASSHRLHEAGERGM